MEAAPTLVVRHDGARGEPVGAGTRAGVGREVDVAVGIRGELDDPGRVVDGDVLGCGIGSAGADGRGGCSCRACGTGSVGKHRGEWGIGVVCGADAGG